MRHFRFRPLGNGQFAVVASVVPILSNLSLTPILTRGLGPVEFGLWATFVALLSLVLFLDVGVGSSLLRFMSLAQASTGRSGSARYLKTAGVYYLVLATGCLLLVLPWHEQLSSFVSSRSNSPTIAIASFCILVALTPISNASLVALQSLGRFKHTAGIIIVSQSVYVASIIILVASNVLDVGTILVAQIAQLTIVTGYVLWNLRVSRLDTVLTKAEVREFGTFSSRIWLTNLSGIPVLQLPTILVTAALAPASAGLFGLASMVALALRNFPLMTVAPTVQTLVGSPEQILKRGFLADRAWRRRLVLYGVIGLVGILVGIPVLGGGEYIRAIGPALVLFLGFMIQLHGALATITARQLGLTKIEWQASALGGIIHLALLWPAISILNIYGPGIVLIISQTVTLVLVRNQFRSLLHAYRTTGK